MHVRWENISHSMQSLFFLVQRKMRLMRATRFQMSLELKCRKDESRVCEMLDNFKTRLHVLASKALTFTMEIGITNVDRSMV